MIKKNVPYKVLKYLWVSLIVLLILNIVGVWVGYSGFETDNQGKWIFGIITGLLVLLDLIAMSVISFLNIKTEIRVHGFAYGALALLHLIFYILTYTCGSVGDRALPALWTVLILAIAAIAVYFALRGKHPFAAFGGKKSGNESSIRREDLGVNPDDAKVDEVANPENNPDRKPGRDEKTGIVSL